MNRKVAFFFQKDVHPLYPLRKASHKKKSYSVMSSNCQNFQFSQLTVTSGAGDVRELGFQTELLTLPHFEKLHVLAFPYKTLSSRSYMKDFSCCI